MALPTARRLREHVRDLAHEMNVTVVHVPSVHGIWGQAQHHPADIHSKRAKRLVLLSHKPTTPMTYMIALHELGHCAPGAGWSADTMLEREAAAWEWAIERAVLPRSLAAHHARECMIDYRNRGELARSERFERLYTRVTRNSRPYRKSRKRAG